MIARAAMAEGGIIMCESTDSIAHTSDVFTGVIYWCHLANAILQSVSRVADADRPGGAKCAPSMCTAVGVLTYVCIGNTLVVYRVVALVTYT